MVGRNPFIGATLPKREQRKRAIWDAETIRRALDACEDDRLYLAIHLAFACSLRFWEICGLTWDCLDISDAAIMNGNAYLKVEKVLARVDEGAVDALGENDIFFTFPAVVNGKSKTRLVLKKPKTESSIRKVWIPVTLAKLLRAWKESQDKAKAYLGDAYYDYNLVLTLDNGRPCEDRVIGNAFNRLKRNADLPDVVFHSLRHSSTTYKLKLNHGDIKATQGDTGHAQPDMVTEIYPTFWMRTARSTPSALRQASMQGQICGVWSSHSARKPCNSRVWILCSCWFSCSKIRHCWPF